MKKGKVKVLYTMIGSGFGGLEKVVMSLINGIDRNVYEPYLLCISQPTEFEEEYERLKAHKIFFGYGRGKHYSLPLKVREIVQSCEIDILHSHDFKAFLYCTVGSIGMQRVIRVFTEHSGIYALEKRHLLAVRILSRVTDALVMVSEDLKQFYKANLRVKEERLRVIYNGVKIGRGGGEEAATEWRKELDIRDGDLIVGTVGRLIEQKGLKYLVEAAPTVIAAIPNAKFVIVGDGRLRASLESAVDKMGLNDRFRFVGYQSNVKRFLEGFDVYALPSLWEGLPLGIIEAMFCSKAIVASRVGGVPELIGNNERGLLVNSGDVNGLAEALISILKDEMLRKQLGARSYEFAQAGFTMDRMVSGYEKLYRDLLEIRSSNV